MITRDNYIRFGFKLDSKHEEWYELLQNNEDKTNISKIEYLKFYDGVKEFCQIMSNNHEVSMTSGNPFSALGVYIQPKIVNEKFLYGVENTINKLNLNKYLYKINKSHPKRIIVEFELEEKYK